MTTRQLAPRTLQPSPWAAKAGSRAGRRGLRSSRQISGQKLLDSLRKLGTKRKTSCVDEGVVILNPDDVDLVLVIKAKVFLKLDGAQRSFCDWFRTSSLYERYKCDNYFLIEEDGRPEGEWFYAYWLRQFGFSRADEMKGLAVVKVPFLVMP